MTAAYIDWNAVSGGASIQNKPALGTFAGQNYASPPAIGGTTPAAITANPLNLTVSGYLLGGSPVTGVAATGAKCYPFQGTSGTGCDTPTGAGNVSNSGTPTSGQLAVWTGTTVIQGLATLPSTAMPTFTGDVTNSGLAMTVGAINGGSVPASAKLLGTNSSSQAIGAALTSGHIYVGNGSSLPADVAASQDVSLANTGAFTVTGAQGKALPALSAFTSSPYLIYTGSAWAAANPFASPTFTGTVSLPITGASQCLK